MKKGFTLIELLAVIVILAIIALIATPIVLSIIEESKESAVLQSAENYLSSVELGVTKKNLTTGGSFSPSVCEVQEDGNLLCDGKDELKIEVNGETPSSGTITFDKGKIIAVELIQANKTITKDEAGKIVLGGATTKACKITLDKDNDGVADIGDMITCSTESFYVISNDGTTISMLAQWNLDVGDIYDNGRIENPTGIQREGAKGYTEETTISYGVTYFSGSYYWWDIDNNEYTVDTNYESKGRHYPFVYGDYKDANGNQQNNLYPYVKAYEEYLTDKGVVSAKATLISNEQLEDLGCASTCNSSKYDWVYSTSYLTGSAEGVQVLVVISNGDFASADWDFGNGYGVRPVVNISVSEI